MKMYDALIRVGGSRDNEAWRRNIPAPEVFLLNAIHGGDAISELDEVGEKNVDSTIKMRKLRNYLRNQYGAKPQNAEIFDGMFGIHPQPLPKSVTMDDLMPEAEEDFGVEEDDIGWDESEGSGKVEATSEKEPEQKTKTPGQIEREELTAQINALGGSLPKGRIGIAKLKEELANLQLAAKEPAPELVSALE